MGASSALWARLAEYRAERLASGPDADWTDKALVMFDAIHADVDWSEPLLRMLAIEREVMAAPSPASADVDEEEQ